MLLAAAEAAIYDAQTLSLRGKFYFPKKKQIAHIRTAFCLLVTGKRLSLFCVFFGKKESVGHATR